MMELKKIREWSGDIFKQDSKKLAGLIYVDVVEYAGLARILGPEKCGRMIKEAGEVLRGLQGEWAEIRQFRRIGDDWLIYAELEEQEPASAGYRLKRLTEDVNARLTAAFHAGQNERGYPLYTGCSLIAPGEAQSGEARLVSAFKRSMRNMHTAIPAPFDQEKDEAFRTILATRNIRSVYQPIVSLQDAAVLGYEALTRGPEESVFYSPLELFGFAEARGELYALDRLAREKAIEGCSGLGKDQRVFINIPAQVIHDPQFAPGATLEILRRCGIQPRNVVLELTERSSIEDFATAKLLLQHYRNQGYQIAIDDAGAGYSSLQAIAELKPDFIKVDRSLIENIHLDKMKETLLEIFVSFARKMSIRIIAEGIECWEELQKLRQLGVHYGQGYLLGYPRPGQAELPEEIVSKVKRISYIQGQDRVMQIGSLASSASSYEGDTPISVIADYFNHNEHVQGTVILDRGKPVGLVMRERLFQQLAGRYGVSLYWSRPINQLMDRAALIVDEMLPVESASQMAMAREMKRLYDLVIITTGEKLLGVASIRSILESITNERMENARVANPLTGLPGNTQISRELNRWILNTEKFVVVYADLDHFKWYNDRFGFQKGDEMIQLTADVLQQSVSACGHPRDFVGHIGGDDFIVMSQTREPEQLCEEIIRRFRLGVELLMEDAEEWGTVTDRNNRPVEGGGLHLSLSLLICEFRERITLDHISETAAALKKKAKSTTGSLYVKAYL
ncbi:MAG: RNase stability modulator [Paenibacillaceae bacterium]|jgi:diguanylate cyclase (GGDEF)-like protein|nr:RNase stability modulator [Paenibacillaceae bacterium]